MEAMLTRAALLGYLGSWSAVSRYRAATGVDPIPELEGELRATLARDERSHEGALAAHRRRRALAATGAACREAIRYTAVATTRESPMKSLAYKGFAITARTYQVRGTGRWTLDLLISRREVLRAFSRADDLSHRGCGGGGVLRAGAADHRWE